MNLLAKQISSSIKGLINHISYSRVSNIRKSFIKPILSQKPVNPLIHFTPQYTFSSHQQPTPPPQQSASSSSTKLQQIKKLFQTQMNKYNLKGLLKMYKILKLNYIPLSQQSLIKFDNRLHTELTQIEHQSVNFLLEIMKQNGQSYQIKGKNKLLRAINLRLQKNKLALQPKHIHKTIKLLSQMNFPKSTISRVLFKLVQQTQPQKRQLHMVDNLSELKIALLAVEMVELDLQIKRRFMENVVLIKPKGVIQLAYFYSVLKSLVTRLEQSVMYEAQKKSVYELAFNPYRNYDDNESSEQNQSHPLKQQTSTPCPQINPTIMKQLLNQKQKLIEDTFKKLNLKEVSAELFSQLREITQDKSEDLLEWKEMKQLCLLLIGNRFGEEGKQNRELVREMVAKVLEEGMKDKVLIRLPEFIILMQELKEFGQNKLLHEYLSFYGQSYYQLMNLQEKLMFTYHKSKLTNQTIDLSHLKSQLTSLDYGLDPEQFVWLNKVLSLGQEKHSIGEKQLVKEIWEIVERKLDIELEGLNRQREEKDRMEAEQKERKRKEEEKSRQNKNKQTQQGKKGTQFNNQK